MMAIDLRSWWQNHYIGDLFDYVDDFSNVLNRLSTSQSYHQYILFRTSITNIDVAVTIRTFPFTESCCRVILKSEVVFGLQTGFKLASKWMVSGFKVTDCIKWFIPKGVCPKGSINHVCIKSEMDGLFDWKQTISDIKCGHFKDLTNLIEMLNLSFGQKSSFLLWDQVLVR